METLSFLVREDLETGSEILASRDPTKHSRSVVLLVTRDSRKGDNLCVLIHWKRPTYMYSL